MAKSTAMLACVLGFGLALAPGRAAAAVPSSVAREAARQHLVARVGVGAGDLTDAADFVVEPLRVGALVHAERRHLGVHIRGGTSVVRVDDAGRVRWAAIAELGVPAALAVTPTVPRLVAPNLAARAVGGGAHVVRAPVLEILPLPGGDARLAWQVRLPMGADRAEPLVVWIDAQDGSFLARESLARTASPERLGTIYRDNPVSTPDALQVDFGPFLAGNGSRLDGADVRATSCLDERTCTGDGDAAVHACALEQTVSVGQDGSFLGFARPADDTTPDDGFAELQAFHHGNRVLAMFHDLGFGNLDQRPLTVIANYRTDGKACVNAAVPADSKLVPYANAAFIGAGGVEQMPDEDSVVIGQGKLIDFAYDGDVMYHELTHAVMFTQTPDVPYGPTFDERGADWTTGGLHEGLADYFSSVVTGDPDVGEYSGAEFALPYIRTLDSGLTCPASLIGEVHRDGQALSSALWTVREVIAPEARPFYDEAVFTVVRSLQRDDDGPSMARRLLDELAVVFDADTVALARLVLTSRGFGDCNERVVDVPDGHVERIFHTATVNLTPIPAVVQLRLVNRSPAARLRVTVDAATADGHVHVYTRPGSAPLTWTYPKVDGHIFARSDATGDGILKLTDPTPGDGRPGSAEGSVAGPFPAGPVMVQLAFDGTNKARLVGLTFTFTDDFAPDAGPDPVPPGDSGCGCTVGGHGRGGLAGAVVSGLLALVFRRRRSRRA